METMAPFICSLSFHRQTFQAPMSFSEEFRKARLRSDLGIKEMARILERGVTTIVRIEKGVKVNERSRLRAEDWLRRFLKS